MSHQHEAPTYGSDGPLPQADRRRPPGRGGASRLSRHWPGLLGLVSAAALAAVGLTLVPRPYTASATIDLGLARRLASGSIASSLQAVASAAVLQRVVRDEALAAIKPKGGT